MDKQQLHCTDVLAPIEKVLRISGVWPVRKYTANYILRTTISWLFSFTLVGLMCAEVIHVMGDLKKINEVATTLSPVFVYCFKLTALVYYRNNFFNIMEILNSDLFNNKKLQKPLQDTMKATEAATKLFRIMTVCVVIFYTIFPFFDEKDLPIPFSFYIGHYKYLMHVFQIASLSLCAWNLINIDLLFAVLMALAAAIIDTLREKLVSAVAQAERLCRRNSICGNNKIMRKDVDSLVMKILRECTILHVTILIYIDQIETIFSFSLLVHYISGILLICSSLLQLTTLVEIHSIQFVLCCVFVVIVTVQFSIYHWFGNEVIVKSNKISDACYESEWYRCNVGVQRMILTLMLGAKKPLGVTIYKFTMLSLISFLTIIRWSYSFTALIKTRYMSVST